jgi:hypothetical protein
LFAIPEVTVKDSLKIAHADLKPSRPRLLFLGLAVMAGLLGPATGAPKLPLVPLPKFLKTAKPEPAESETPKPPETRFVQVYPEPKDPAKFTRSKSQRRAVVLIHGYCLCFKKDRVPKAILKDWEEKGSPLVNVLGKDSDVFAFAYGQTVAVDEIAHLRGLRDGIAALKKLGYKRIVLVGHSAGGLVARYFVEDFPEAGVTKVVQVCAPNGGSHYTDIKFIPKNHKLFVKSLSQASREKCLHDREKMKIPNKIQFVCILGVEDLVVPCKCQWPQDLQQQGVPVVKCVTGHRHVMRKTKSAQKIAEVIREDYPRWKPVQVTEALKEIFKTKKKIKEESQ